MELLNQDQITKKIKRLAIEILEQNFDEKEIVLLGINNNGYGFAQLLYDQLPHKKNPIINLKRIRLNPADPLGTEITIDHELEDLNDKVIIVVDDVANTGRTLFYAMKPLMNILPRKVQIAVLVERKHKSYPVVPDYVGVTLATTLMDNIDVKILNTDKQMVFLT
ncbi:MAG: phosphoribosyltransferase [Bacteroidia bacterium]|nr:phosphoribosyltransferase [Bacteroidia bacterium]